MAEHPVMTRLSSEDGERTLCDGNTSLTRTGLNKRAYGIERETMFAFGKRLDSRDYKREASKLEYY